MHTRKNIKQTIRSINNLPSHPIVLDRITKLLANPRTSAEEIGKAITTDQALASKALKLVNSAFYGFPGRISTMSHAIVILGFSTVKNIVLTASIFDSFRGKGKAPATFNLEQLWYHSIACGAAAQYIAKQVGSQEREECFIAGLIHDIGKIILCNYLPKDFEAVIAHAGKNNVLFYESEKALFDTAHDEIGAFLAECWNLPKNLQTAVAFHHQPGLVTDGSKIAAIIHAADIFVRALDCGNGGDSKIPIMADQVWKMLDLENKNLNTMFEGIKEEIDKAAVFFQFS